MFEAINLDGLTNDPKDMTTVSDTLATLSRYARHKATAMELRSNGQIAAAMEVEKLVERVYKQLPKWAKW